ncbi:threonine/serine exporter family protein [Nigerium sp.]|uniref:threonine/serine ThrE exporter family protein n=1 Tax=Nigerium sp. TaxID=2042655 RepID=UPI003221D162
MAHEETAGAREAALAEKADAMCRMGSMMLAAGTGSYRVKAAMGRVAQALGIEQLEAQVSLNEIVATTRSRGTFRTEVVEVPTPVVNADRIGSLMRLSLRARDGMTAAELQTRLDRIGRRHALYSRPSIVAAAAMACAAFAFLNNGRWQECLAAGLAAALGKAVQLALHRARLNQLAVVAGASAAACTLYMLLAFALQFVLPVGGEPLHQAAFTSAILFLVPGFPLMTAALDLARFDFTSGVSRLAYAAMITMATALGAWVVALWFGLSPLATPPLQLPLWAVVGARALASFFGVLGFAITFNTPLRVAVVASTIGTLANLARLAAVDLGWNALLCALGATTIVGLLAAFAARHIVTPRVTLSVPAVLIMIPGASAFRALVALINNDPMAAVLNGTTSLFVVISLAAGLVVARMLTDQAWIEANPHWTAMPHTRAQTVLLRQERAAEREAERAVERAIARDVDPDAG